MVKSDTALLKYVMRHDDRSDMMHSSGYAKAQNGSSFGAAGGTSFSERKNIEERRKYVQGYRNSKIMNSFYGVERARTTIPRSGAGAAGADTNSASNGGARTTGGVAGGSLGNRGSATNPMDTAMQRAKFSASGGNRPAPSVPRAPQIPMRRSGI